MNRNIGMLAVLVFCLIGTCDFTLAYTWSNLTSDLATRLLPYTGVLFLMIGFPFGVGIVWRYIPGLGRAGVVAAIIMIEIVAPMGLPDGVGANYRDLWNQIWNKFV